MRVAYLYSRYPVISQTFCDSEMLGLEREGVELTVASLNPPPDAFRHQRLKKLQAVVEYLPSAGRVKALAENEDFESRCGERLQRHVESYGESFKSEVRARNGYVMGRRLQALGVQHVHVHFANRATHAALFMKDLGLSFSFTAHAQDFMVDLGSDALLKEMCEEASFVVAVSDFSKGLLAKVAPEVEAQGKLRRLYNGIEPSLFPQSLPSTENVSEEVFKLVSVGRLIEFKGFHHLIEASARLQKEGVKVEANIIGEGPWRNRLKEQIDAAGLRASVRLLGSQGLDEIKQALASSDAFVLPCVVDEKGASDILPTVIMEAMACGLPVVSTRLAGVPEMVAHEESGLLVEPGDVGGLVEALRRLQRSQELGQRYGERAIELVKERFDLKTNVGVLKSWFEECLGESAESAKEVTSKSLAAYASRMPSSQEHEALAEAEVVQLWSADIEAVPSDCEGSRARYTALESWPDGVVLESWWREGEEQARFLEGLRGKWGNAVDGEKYFQEARRALYLWRQLRLQGIKALHGLRAEDGLVVALVHALQEEFGALDGWSFSLSVEERPSGGRALLRKVVPVLTEWSCADAVLCEELGAKDVLGLKEVPSHRKVSIGPVKIKLRQEQEERDWGKGYQRVLQWHG